MIKTIEYKGRKYYASGTNPKYFYNDIYIDKKRQKRALHHQVYIDNYGPIPEGCDIHHKDEDTLNNDPLNLEAVPLSEHRSAHIKKRLLDESVKMAHVKPLRDNSDKAIEWHRSEEGRAWHRENGVKSWENRTTRTNQCGDCNTVFESVDPKQKFCCNKCWQRARRKKLRALTAA